MSFGVHEMMLTADIPPGGDDRPSKNAGRNLLPGTTEVEQASDGGKVPLVAHVIFRLDVGGLENGLVNLINFMPEARYQHAIICLTEYSDFRFRLKRSDVELFALHKQEGKDFVMYFRLWRLLRKLRPQIIHTRNLAALESMFPAMLAGVKHRIHGEHGRDIDDLDGSKAKYVWLRRAHRRLVDRYIPMSQDLASWLLDCIGVDEGKISQIYNGVDTDRFRPPSTGREVPPELGSLPSDCVVIGSVGRMEPVKDQLTLVKAFIQLLQIVPDGRQRLRLVHIGDGALRGAALSLLEDAGAKELAWLPGVRDDVPALLRALDVFVLPSRAEGISNTVLEAMASGLPVVATDVGGNPELVTQGKTGVLVPPGNPLALADALRKYIDAPELMRQHGEAGYARVLADFSIGRMVRQYLDVYDTVLGKASA